MEFTYLDINDNSLTEANILEALNNNARVARVMRKDIERWRKAAESSKGCTNYDVVEPPKSVKIDTKPNVVSRKKTAFDKKVAKYLSKFNATDVDSLVGNVDDILPKPSDYDYKNIILALIAEMYKQINEFTFFLEQEDLSEDDFDEINSEIEELQDRIIFLNNLIKEKKEIPVEQRKNNHLIFISTEAGNIIALNEIEKIDPSFYDRFLVLFEQIKSGYWEVVGDHKRFDSNSVVKSFSEVREFQVRVVFKRLSSDCFAIVTAFTKKDYNDKGYQNSLKTKVAHYYRVEKALLEQLSNPEFMAAQEQYEIELFRKLGKEFDEGVKVYGKIGDPS